MFLNIRIDWIILKTYDQQFTLTTKKSLHIIFNVASPPQMSSSIVFTRWRQCALILAPPGEYNWTRPSVRPPKSITQMANRSVQPFLHSSWQKVPILYHGCPFPPKLSLTTLDRVKIPPSNTWFLLPIRAHSPNDILISSAVFAQTTTVSLYNGKPSPPP